MEAPISQAELHLAVNDLQASLFNLLSTTFRSPHQPIGHYRLCEHATAQDELSALCTALELWRQIGHALSDDELDLCQARIHEMQREDTGLCVDPTWEGRLSHEGQYMLSEGCSFFTRTAFFALGAHGRTMKQPVTYLQADAQKLLDQLIWERGAHHPFALGDFSALLQLNRRFEVKGAEELQQRLMEALLKKQNLKTGLWMGGDEGVAEIPYTPHINRTFHVIKYSFNINQVPLPHSEKIIDCCLHAKDDPDHYGSDTGYGCNDLDLAHVLYSARCWTGHRADEVADWARRRIRRLLARKHQDGGFSFLPKGAMTQHCHLKVSDGQPESDLWGCVMYTGAIAMMCRLAWPDENWPLEVARVHAVPYHTIAQQ